eukprot:jgi/Orpsp1_1/1177127/evm.model.c7180000060286.1
MTEASKINNYLIYGAIALLVVLILTICCVSIEYYKRKVKRLKLELYRETQAKENQLSSRNTSVVTSYYNYPSFMTQTSVKKGSYVDNYNYDEEDDNMTSLSNYVSYDNKPSLKVNEGIAEIPDKQKEKYQSLYSINTTTQSIHSLKPSYSYYSLANHDSQNPQSLYLNSHNNTVFYDEIPNNTLNSQVDTVTTISTATTTTITTTNINSTNVMAYPPVSVSKTSNRSTIMSGISNVRNYAVHTWNRSPHDKLKINTSGIKSNTPLHSAYKSSQNSPNLISTPKSAPIITPKHRLLNYPSNSSFIQSQNNIVDSVNEESSFFTTKPISTTMITTTTLPMTNATDNNQYVYNGPDNLIIDNKKLSLVHSQEKYSQSPRESTQKTPLSMDGTENDKDIDNEDELAKRKSKNRRSYTEQLKPILSNISLAELKEANATRPQSAKLSSDKIKVIKVKKHRSYTEQLTPILTEKRSSIISEHRLSSVDKSKFRHSIQSIQSIHSVQSVQSIHNVVDEELVSPRPISLISNQRLSFMTSEMEEQLNQVTSSESSKDSIEIHKEEVIVLDSEKTEKEKDIEILNSEKVNDKSKISKELSSDIDKKMILNEKGENSSPIPETSSALARVSLLIDRLEKSSNSPISQKSENNSSNINDNLKKNIKQTPRSPLSENNDNKKSKNLNNTIINNNNNIINNNNNNNNNIINN